MNAHSCSFASGAIFEGRPAKVADGISDPLLDARKATREAPWDELVPWQNYLP